MQMRSSFLAVALCMAQSSGLFIMHSQSLCEFAFDLAHLLLYSFYTHTHTHAYKVIEFLTLATTTTQYTLVCLSSPPPPRNKSRIATHCVIALCPQTHSRKLIDKYLHFRTNTTRYNTTILSRYICFHTGAWLPSSLHTSSHIPSPTHNHPSYHHRSNKYGMEYANMNPYEICHTITTYHDDMRICRSRRDLIFYHIEWVNTYIRAQWYYMGWCILCLFVI